MSGAFDFRQHALVAVSLLISASAVSYAAVGGITHGTVVDGFDLGAFGGKSDDVTGAA